MAEYEGPHQARNALVDAIIAAPSAVEKFPLSKLRDFIGEPSPVVATVNALELLYAYKEDGGTVPAALKDWAAGAALMAEVNGFHGMNEGSRGTKLAKAMRGQAVAGKRPEARTELLAPPKVDTPPNAEPQP